MSKTIAISGQFDTLVPSFLNYHSRHIEDKNPAVVIAPEPLIGMTNVIWRTGSLIRSKNIPLLLNDIQTLLYFALTPPDNARTKEGFAKDVALISALNIAQCAHHMPHLNVILITREFQNPICSDHSVNYDFWFNLTQIFIKECPKTTIIQTSPLLSENDAIAQSIYERCLDMSEFSDSNENLGFTAPCSEAELFSTIEQCISTPEHPQHIHLHGPASITYGEWFLLAKKAIPRKKILKGIHKLRNKLSPDSQLRASLLDETLHLSPQIPTTSSIASLNLKKNIRHLFEDLSEFNSLPSLMLPSANRIFEATDSPCYVQRILNHPKQNVSQIADLLMAWLPRYFQRLLRVEDIGTNRVLCRCSRIPLLELEKSVESPNRCHLYMRCPWTASIQNQAQLIITTTGDTNTPETLMIIIEETPDFHALKLGFRAILIAFGHYLKEYGCGN